MRLSRCPFCHRRGTAMVADNGAPPLTRPTAWFGLCQECGAQGPIHMPEGPVEGHEAVQACISEAARLWNRRGPADGVAARRPIW